MASTSFSELFSPGSFVYDRVKYATQQHIRNYGPWDRQIYMAAEGYVVTQLKRYGNQKPDTTPTQKQFNDCPHDLLEQLDALVQETIRSASLELAAKNQLLSQYLGFGEEMTALFAAS